MEKQNQEATIAIVGAGYAILTDNILLLAVDTVMYRIAGLVYGIELKRRFNFHDFVVRPVLLLDIEDMILIQSLCADF